MADVNFIKCPVFCGQLQRPGLAVDFDLYVDFSNRDTTDDQARIEAVLDEIVVSQSRLLHVGIGNSKLAEKFSVKGVVVDGITVSETEMNYAQSLAIDNYRVFKVNKYHRSFADCVDSCAGDSGFDFIVDNNLASFTCCQYHFYQMLDNYLGCLKVGGKILTDQRGMDWALASPGFILGFDELKAVLDSLPVKVSRITDMVYAIELLPSELTETQPNLIVYAKRYQDDGQSIISSFSPQDTTVNHSE